jgi:hypothetical protein
MAQFPRTDFVLRFFGRNRWPDPVTFGLFCPGFGDVLRSVQHACWVQETFGIQVSLYTLWHGIPGADYSETPLSDKERLIREVLPLLDTSAHIRLVKERHTRNYFSLWGVYPFWVPVVPTRVRWAGWRGKQFKRIAYQFDGASRAEKKNPPVGDHERLLAFAPGYEFVNLGQERSVADCIGVAAHSDLFVGVDSGMLQLCYAVGVPVFLIRYRQDEDVLAVWHGLNHAVHCTDTDDFLRKARAFLGMG